MFALRMVVIAILGFVCCAQNNLNITEDPYYTIEPLKQDYEKNREALIHKLCIHRSRFTENELETARVYLQTRYINGSPIKPQKPPCKSIKVVRDFKCLSHNERIAFIDAFKKLYVSGVIDKISYYHGGYWPFVHLTSETIAFHNKFLLDLQQQIEKINPEVIMPYWDTTLDFFAPHKSIIWDYFGYSGNASNDYCIPDGPFNNQTVKYPFPHCIRREWNSDGSIPAWESPEFITSALQITKASNGPFGGFFGVEHFKKHLSIGGYNGDMSIPYATNEPLFHLFHLYALSVQLMKWYLLDDQNLIPVKVSHMSRRDPPYEYEGKWVDTHMETDTILGYNTTTIAEASTFGFGEFCYISDQIIESINTLFSDVKPKLPVAFERLRNALPPIEFQRLFPIFATKQFNELSFMLPDLGNGNINHTCKPLPLPPSYNSTENGKRQLNKFNAFGYDGRNDVMINELTLNEVINTLNKYNYCSPYIS